MGSKKDILNKIITDLPIQECRGEMTKEEWYGWFEEAFDKGYKQANELKLYKANVSFICGAQDFAGERCEKQCVDCKHRGSQ